MMSKGISKGFFILILFIVTAAFLDVLGPYYSSVLWAIILAVIFHPVKKKLKQYVGERNGVVSLLTLALICLIVFTPLAIIASSLAMEFNVIYTKLQTNNSQLPTMLADFMRHLPGWAQRFWRSITSTAPPRSKSSFPRWRSKVGNTWRAACS